MKSTVLLAALVFLRGSAGATSYVHTTQADFESQARDGHLEVQNIAGGELVLRKKAGSLGPFSGAGSLPYGVTGPLAFVAHDHLYIIGGNAGSNINSVRSAPFTSDTTLGSWTSLANFPVTVSGGGLVRWGDWIYAVGGTQNGSNGSGIYKAKVMPGGQLGTWTLAGNQSVAAAQRAVAAFGYLFYTGGHNGSTYQDKTYRQPILGDGSLGTAVEVTGSPLPGPNSNFAPATGAGFIYVLGGDNDTNPIRNWTLRAQPAEDGSLSAWSSQATLPNGRTWLTGVDHAGYGKLFTIAGHDGTLGDYYSQEAFSTSVNGDGSVDAWSTETSLSSAYSGGTPVFHRGGAWHLGGWTSGMVHQSTILRASLNLGGANASKGVFGGVFDLGSDLGLGQLSWTASPPASVSVQYRVAPDSTKVFGAWSSPTTSSPAVLAGSGRWVEYLLVLSDPGSGSVSVSEVSLATTDPTPSPTPTSNTWSHTSLADFRMGDGDAGYVLADTAGGEVQLAKQASGLGSWSQSTPLPLNLDQATGFTTDEYAYVFGGVTRTGGVYECYHLIYAAPFSAAGGLGSWSQLGTVPSATGSGALMGATRWTRFVYLAGGILNQAPSYTTTNKVYRAEILPGGAFSSWTAVSNLPRNLVGVELFAEKGHLFYVAEQDIGFAGPKVYSAAIRGDGSLDAWIEQSATPYPIPYVNKYFAFLGGYFFVAGGNTQAPAYTNTAYSSAINGDGTLNSWSALATLPATRSQGGIGHSAGHGRMFLAGGRTNSSASANVESAALGAGGALAGGWTSETPLPQSKGNGVVGVSRGSLWLIGGSTASGFISNVYVNALVLGGANAAAGSYRNRFDLGADRNLGQLSWNGSPAANISMQARVAPSGGAFGAWSAPGTASPITLSGSGRYVEYRVAMTDPGAGTLQLEDVTLNIVLPTPTPSPTPSAAATPGPGNLLKDEVRAHPNPVKGNNDKIKFAFKLDEAGLATLRVWNSGGQLAATVTDQLGKGQSLLPLTIRDFAPGIYLYQLSVEYASGRKQDFAVQRFAITP